MKITIESTTKIVQLAVAGAGTLRTRVWEGKTEGGVPCHAFIAIVSPTVPTSDPGIAEACAEFERDLQEHVEPSHKIAAIPLRMVL